MNNESLLGLDFGTKKVGVAISHGFMAEADIALDYSKKEKFLEDLKKIIAKQKITKVVIGLPLKDGEETAQSRWIREQSTALKNDLNLPVEFVDEAFSSLEADKFTGDRDSESARIILEQFLKEKK